MASYYCLMSIHYCTVLIWPSLCITHHGHPRREEIEWDITPPKTFQRVWDIIYLMTAGRSCYKKSWRLPGPNGKEEIWEMSHVPPHSEELSNPLSGHMLHGMKSWSYQYSIVSITSLTIFTFNFFHCYYLHFCFYLFILYIFQSISILQIHVCAFSAFIYFHGIHFLVWPLQHLAFLESWLLSFLFILIIAFLFVYSVHFQSFSSQ